MHLVLLTMMALTGADTGQVATSSPSDAYYAVPGEVSGADCTACSCDSPSCGMSHAERIAAKHAAKAAARQRKHMMPQTCYQPRFGCYYSGNRMMNRYPAFHGTFYRRPYNYRNLFEYPWHAELHEPTSLFSYNVETNEVPAAVIDASSDGAPVPPPPAQASRKIRVSDKY